MQSISFYFIMNSLFWIQKLQANLQQVQGYPTFSSQGINVIPITLYQNPPEGWAKAVIRYLFRDMQ